MTSVTVDLTLEIIIPRIKAGNELAPEVQKEWDLFIAGVVSHENEHVRLYKAGAADLEKRLRSFSSSCKNMQRDASAIEKAGAERMQKMNDDYDAETDGGRKDQDNAID
jgi:predicted secreted Zn-dependent protease